MVAPRDAFAKMDRERALGSLRATGSRDPDVLRARKGEMVRTARVPKLLGAALLIAGGLVSLAVGRTLAGVPVAALGAWLWWRGARNVAVVEAAYEELVKFPEPGRRVG